jgi:hypothetical protein
MNLEHSQLNGPGRSLLRFEGVPSLCGMDICGVSVPQHWRNFFGVHAIPTQIVATILETPFRSASKAAFQRMPAFRILEHHVPAAQST